MKPKLSCSRGDEVGRLKASWVDDMAVRDDWRVVLDGAKRFVNQLMVADDAEDGGRIQVVSGRLLL